MDFVYRGLEAKYSRHIVTEEEVDHQLHRVLQSHPRIEEVTDRPAALGDEVVLDYAGYCDGEQFAGGTAENQTLVLGSGMFIPGFEEQLVDKVCEEKVIVKVTFPKEYHAENLAGKDAEFHCTIHQIRIKSQYELDDTFAKEVGGVATFEEMRAKMKDSMQAYVDDRGEMDLQDRLLRQAAETLDFKITDDMMAAALDDQMQNLEAQLAQQGLNLDMYCQFMKTTPEAIREDMKPQAETALRCNAAIDLIVEIEGLTAEKEEIAEALALVCRQNGMTMEQMKPHYDAELEHAITRSVLTSKVMRLVRDAATVTAE